MLFLKSSSVTFYFLNFCRKNPFIFSLQVYRGKISLVINLIFVITIQERLRKHIQERIGVIMKKIREKKKPAINKSFERKVAILHQSPNLNQQVAIGVKPQRLVTLKEFFGLLGSSGYPSKQPPFETVKVSGGSADASLNGAAGIIEAWSKVPSCGGGDVEGFMVWTYTPQITQDIDVTLEAEYALRVKALSANSGAGFSGGACAYIIVGVEAKDLTAGGASFHCMLERLIADSISVASVEGIKTGTPPTLTIRRGHTYQLSVFLHVYASAYTDPSTTGPACGNAEAHAELQVFNIALVLPHGPSITTKLTSYMPVQYDTYKFWEYALYSTTGKRYFPTSAYFEITASGHFDGQASFAEITVQDGQILEVLGSPTTANIRGSTVRLPLPSSDNLPLSGRTWIGKVIFDPNITLARLLPVPLVSGLFWFLDTSIVPMTFSSKPGVKSPAPSKETVLTLKNWNVILPLSALDVQTEGVKPTKTPLPILVYAPKSARIQFPALEGAEFKITNPPVATLPQFNEPTVSLNVGEIFDRFQKARYGIEFIGFDKLLIDIHNKVVDLSNTIPGLSEPLKNLLLTDPRMKYFTIDDISKLVHLKITSPPGPQEKYTYDLTLYKETKTITINGTAGLGPDISAKDSDSVKVEVKFDFIPRPTNIVRDLHPYQGLYEF